MKIIIIPEEMDNLKKRVELNNVLQFTLVATNLNEKKVKQTNVYNIVTDYIELLGLITMAEEKVKMHGRNNSK